MTRLIHRSPLRLRQWCALAWLAMAGILLAPVAAQHMAVGGVGNSDWVEVCSAIGNRWVRGTDGASAERRISGDPTKTNAETGENEARPSASNADCDWRVLAASPWVPTRDAAVARCRTNTSARQASACGHVQASPRRSPAQPGAPPDRRLPPAC